MDFNIGRFAVKFAGAVSFPTAATAIAVYMGIMPTANAATNSASQALSAKEAYLVSSLTYQSAAAQAAMERQHSGQLQQLQTTINAKDAELRKLRKEYRQANTAAANAKNRVIALELEIVELKRSFAEQLAALDAEFSLERQTYEAAAYDLLQTSDGRAAIELFLSGEEGSAQAAIEILRRVAIKRNAADKRAIARLGSDAKAQGRVSIAYVSELWKDVVAVDQGDSSDWTTLSLLYLEAGRFDDAMSAAQQSVKVAKTPRERLLALGVRGKVFSALKNFDASLADSQEALEIARQLRDADVFSTVARTDLMYALTGYGVAVRLGSDGKGINKNAELTRIFEETQSLAFSTYQENPRSVRAMQNVVRHTIPLVQHRIEINDIGNSMELAGVSVFFAHMVDQLQPKLLESKRDLALSLVTLGNLQHAIGNREPSIKAYTKALETANMLLQLDPELEAAKQLIAMVSVRLAEIGAPGHSYTKALAALEKLNDGRTLSAEEDRWVEGIKKSALAETGNESD